MRRGLDEIKRLLAEIGREVERDSFNLTRDQMDAAAERLRRTEEFFDGLYGKGR